MGPRFCCTQARLRSLDTKRSTSLVIKAEAQPQPRPAYISHDFGCAQTLVPLHSLWGCSKVRKLRRAGSLNVTTRRSATNGPTE